MDCVQVQGGMRLFGEVDIQGSKNAALPILAATLIYGDEYYIRNCPKISDVHSMISLIKSLGGVVLWESEGVRIDSRCICDSKMPSEAIKGMRSSLCLLGALIARCGHVSMEYPGGCMIGARPIDIHIEALEKLGVDFEFDSDMMLAKCNGLEGCEISLPFPSVGATENIILASMAARGTTKIIGAAREPEVVYLCDFLVKCGAVIEGIGSREITIRENINYKGIEYNIPGDRIVAGTYMFATVAARGEVFLRNAPYVDMARCIACAEKMGAVCELSSQGIYIQMSDRPTSCGRIRTDVYPGFPTDLQSVALVVASVAEGETVIEERIFENRFQIVPELKRMGSKIEFVNDYTLRTNGVWELKPAEVSARELRGGAALVVAALLANGTSKVYGYKYIFRGYEHICEDLRKLGARITCV